MMPEPCVPCAICDADDEGNIPPASAERLCASHWPAVCVRSLVQSGAWSEFAPDAYGKHVNHKAMMTSDMVADARQQALEKREERTGVGMACDIRRWVELAALLTPLGVEWAAPGADSLSDALAVERGVLDARVFQRIMYWMQQRKYGKAA